MSQTYSPLAGSDLFADSFTKLNNSDDTLRSNHSGTTAPTSPIAHQFWVDTANGLLKVRNAANDAWITIGSLASFLGLLPLAGGVMSGAIDMGGFTITNLGLGTGTAAARQQELDLKAPLAAPAFTGDATVNQDPAGNNSLTRKIWAEGRYLKLSGGTMTGAVTLSADAAASLHPVSLQQLIAFNAFSTSSGHRHTGTDARKVKAVDLDGTGGLDGQAFRSFGGSTVGWGRIPFVGVQVIAGLIDASGGKLQSFGTFTVTKTGTGAYTIAPDSGQGITDPPMVLATIHESNVTDRTIRTLSHSPTFVEIFTRSGGSQVDSGFSFLIA